MYEFPFVGNPEQSFSSLEWVSIAQICQIFRINILNIASNGTVVFKKQQMILHWYLHLCQVWGQLFNNWLISGRPICRVKHKTAVEDQGIPVIFLVLNVYRTANNLQSMGVPVKRGNKCNVQIHEDTFLKPVRLASRSCKMAFYHSNSYCIV